MTRGGENIEVGGGLRKFLDTRRGDSEKIVGLGGGLRKSVYFKTDHGLQFKPNRRGSSKIEPLARGAAKISSFEFQYLHRPPTPLVILHELSQRISFPKKKREDLCLISRSHKK